MEWKKEWGRSIEDKRRQEIFRGVEEWKLRYGWPKGPIQQTIKKSSGWGPLREEWYHKLLNPSKSIFIFFFIYLFIYLLDAWELITKSGMMTQ